MGELPGRKEKTRPDWQQEEASQSVLKLGQDSQTVEAAQHAEPPPPRAVLLEQASAFLKDDEIREASTERKIAFLQSKGLTDDETYRLLDLPFEASELKTEEAGTEEISTKSFSSQTEQQESASSQSAPQHSVPKDNPPIITYPEFLLHSQKPPPLVTASRIINAFYLFSGIAAAVYGTSNYLVKPMLESLTLARHSLASTAQANLNALNENLEENISTIPSAMPKYNIGGDDGDDDDSSETTEDIAPLFNRTIGTQTSPPNTPLSSALQPSVSSPASNNNATTQQSSLTTLQTALSSILSPEDARLDNDNLRFQLDDLKQYLNSLKHTSLHARALAESKDDAVNKLKAEIRGMKGVLLSARNFPSGATAGRGFGGRFGE